MSEKLPEEWLSTRHDAAWEEKQSPTRVAEALVWAEPLLIRIQALMKMRDPDDGDLPETDLSVELYDGLRDRLTRNDLLYIALLWLNKRTDDQAEAIMVRAARDLELIDTLSGRQRLTDPPS